MKHLPQRVAALLLAAVMSLTLTGCMFRSSVEDLFTLPRVSAEYEGLSQELDDLQKQGYELVGPSTGQNIQPVQMVDLDNDGLSEALVFMRLQDDEKPLKIFVFRPEDDTYHRLCVIESSGTAIDSVQYEDLTGNGRLEIIVGWRVSMDLQALAVYSLEPWPCMCPSRTPMCCCKAAIPASPSRTWTATASRACCCSARITMASRWRGCISARTT